MFRIIVHIILFLALSALIGGILFFGAGVASVVFRPDLLPGRTLAGAVNAAVLHRLNILEGVCAAIIPLALGYLAFTVPRAASRIAFGLSIAILIVVMYAGLKLFPEVNALRLEIGDFDHVLALKEGLLDRFGSLHKLYTRLTQGILIASLLILISQVVVLSRAMRPVKSEPAKPGADESKSRAVEETRKSGPGKSEDRAAAGPVKRDVDKPGMRMEKEEGEEKGDAKKGESPGNGKESVGQVAKDRSGEAKKK